MKNSNFKIPDIPGFELMLNKLENLFDLKVAKVRELNVGGNNKLFCLVLENGGKLLSKFYYKDNRKRLYNEFTAFTFLKSLNFTEIPETMIKDDNYNYAVYSFIDGETKSIEQSTKDDLRRTIDFLVRLEVIHPTEVSVHFNNLPSLHTSLQNQIDIQIFKFLKLKEETSQQKLLNPKIKNLLRKYDVNNLIPDLFNKAVDGMSEKELKKPFNKDLMRLGCTDFGGDNVIYKPDGSVCFIDFEDFGWSNPLSTIADFVNHVKRLKLTKVNRDYFIQLYRKQSSLPQSFLAKLDIVLELDLIGWLCTILLWTFPDKLKVRDFATVNFNEDEYIQEKIDYFKLYLSRIENKRN